MEATHHTAQAATGTMVHAASAKFADRTLCGVALTYRLALSPIDTLETVAGRVNCPSCAERCALVLSRRARA